MKQRPMTGVIVLAALLGALLYLWQPWDQSGTPNLKLGLDLQGGLRVVLESEEPNPAREDLNTARGIIENRINAFGVAEPVIQTSGNNRVVVELPGLSSEDQERALDLIGQQAVLEFRIVKPGATDPITLDELEPTAFTGEMLSGASAEPDQFGQYRVSFDVKREVASDFGQFTSSNIGRRMAIVLDDNVVSAPVINGRIDTQGSITGSFGIEEASDLALVLRSGSLPINLHVAEIRAIGPTLGQDSINAGTTAAIIGGLAVVLCILLYYGPLFGGVLTVGLIYIMILIFGVLAGLGAAITLPGLAGLVLTLGAAVDGNVISFERIKEELREGKSLRLAMKAGFSNSLSAIVDANVTTLLALAALYQYTTGPVRGFAITLAIGIVASVFTNIVVVPFWLDVLTVRFKRPLMPKGFYAEGIQFVRRAPIIMSASFLLTLAALVLVIVRPLNLSTDFTGGTNALYQVSEDTTISEVRSAIDNLGYEGITGEGASIQELKDTAISEVNTEGSESTADSKLISVRIGITENNDISDQFARALEEELGAELRQAAFVGPSVGADLRRGAFLAGIIAFGLILLYVAWRFWPNWIVAFATVIASLHDVMIVIGALVLFGAQFSIPVLAALLFVVGYSLNDSIIIADRIRENLRKVRNLSYAEIADLSVNETLSRTVMTSFTTLLPVLALLIFGGSVLRDFSLTLLIGIGFGIYSSVFVVAPMIVWFKSHQRESPRARRRTA